MLIAKIYIRHVVCQSSALFSGASKGKKNAKKVLLEGYPIY